MLVKCVAVRYVRCWLRGRRSFDRGEDRAGRLAFQDLLAFAAAGAVGVGEANACERRLVRGADFAPKSHRIGIGLFGTRCIAVGKSHSPAREGRACGQRFALESGGYEFQLVGG